MSLKKSKEVAAVVVTFNKVDLLVDAIHAILNQELLPDIILIVDNNSTDLTYDTLLNKGWIKEIDGDVIGVNTSSTNEYLINGNNVLIRYIKKFENDGGAGGFYEGMKQAYDLGYKWFWLMDDDGVADKNCLKELYLNKNNNVVSGPLVIDIESKLTASFIFSKENNKELALVENLVKEDVLDDVLTPFNGTFISRIVVDKIGFIKREMFIWGDESEYQHRILKNGFVVNTVTKAKHYHPINKKKPKYKSEFLKFTIYDISNPKFQFIFFRNYIFLSKQYPSRVKYGINIGLLRWIYEACINSFYNLIIGDFYKSKICILAIRFGLKNDFTLDKV